MTRSDIVNEQSRMRHQLTNRFQSISIDNETKQDLKLSSMDYL